MALYEVSPTRMQGSGSYFKGRAGEVLARFKLVCLGTNGTWYLADADAVASMPVIGLTMERCVAGQILRILKEGYIGTSTWAWTTGGEIYASNTAGELTQTPPAGVGDTIQQVGTATKVNMIYFNPKGSGAGTGCTILEGATAYVGFDECKEPYANYFLCDGTADDVQIQQAIDYVNGLGGGSIYIEDGTYTISATVILYDDISLFGSGRETVLFSIASLDSTIITATNKTGILIENIKFDGNEANQTGVSHGVALLNCGVSTVSNCWFTEIRNHALRALGSSDVLFVENHFDEIHMRAIDVDTNAGVQSFRVVSAFNTIQMATADLQAGAIAIHYEEIRSGSIIGNQILGSGQGSGLADDGITVNTDAIPTTDITEDIVVVGNTVEECDGACITVDRTNYVVVAGNTMVSGSTYGLQMASNATNCTISGNVVRGMTQRGFQIVGCDLLTFIGNVAATNGGWNIHLDDCENCTLSGNTTQGSTAAHGLVLNSCHYISIEAHHSEGNSGRGVHIYDSSSYVTFQGIVENNGQQGILVTDSTYVKIHDSIITGNTNEGIGESGTSDHNWFYNNDLLGNSVPVVIAGANTKLPTIKGGFSRFGGGSAGQTAPVINTTPGGIDIDGNDEFVFEHIPLPMELQQVVRIKLWAYSNVLEADAMRLRIVSHGATDNEAWNGNAVDVPDHPSESTNFAANDVIYWLVDASDDAQIGALAAQDLVELMAVGEIAGGADCATDALFGGWEIEYV